MAGETGVHRGTREDFKLVYGRKTSVPPPKEILQLFFCTLSGILSSISFRKKWVMGVLAVSHQ